MMVMIGLNFRHTYHTISEVVAAIIINNNLHKVISYLQNADPGVCMLLRR